MTPTSTTLLPGSGCSSVGNTTTESTLLSTTITANTISDGDTLQFGGQIDVQNSASSNIVLTLRLYFGGSLVGTLITGNVFHGATTHRRYPRLEMVRQNTELAISIHSGAGTSNPPPDAFSFPSGNADAIQFSIAPNFGQNNNLEITAQWGSADANAIVTANSGKLLQY